MRSSTHSQHLSGAHTQGRAGGRWGPAGAGTVEGDRPRERGTGGRERARDGGRIEREREREREREKGRQQAGQTPHGGPAGGDGPPAAAAHLQDALPVRGRHDPQVLVHEGVPSGRQLPHARPAREQVPLQLETQDHVHRVRDLAPERAGSGHVTRVAHRVRDLAPEGAGSGHVTRVRIEYVTWPRREPGQIT